MEEKKNINIGRPKKNTLLDSKYFHRVTNEPLYNSSMMEFFYTNPFEFRKYLNTFKSNNVSVFWIVCKKTEIYFCGNVDSKQYNNTCFSNKNCSLVLNFNCNNVYHYYYTKDIYLTINNKEFMNTLISEIGESSCEVGFTINNNSSNQINISIRNSILRSKQELNVKCDFMDISKFDVKILRNTKVFACMENVNIIEYKKMLTTKFKKKVNESKLIIQPESLILQFFKDMDNPMEARIDEDYNYYNDIKKKQCVKFFSDEMISMYFPKSNITSFLLHIKGHINIIYGDKVIILEYKNNESHANENDVVFISNIGVELDV
jgi:hypothetical protein